MATVAGSELTFLDAAGKVLGAERVTHVNQRSGVTTWPFAQPVTAERVRWRTVQPGSPHSCLGGAELAFFTAEAAERLPSGVVVASVPATTLERQEGQILQPLRFTLDYPYAQPCDAVLEIEGMEPQKLRLTWGTQEVRLLVPEFKEQRTVRHWLRVGGETVVTGQWSLEPVRPLTIYILPHSHVDIGYTELQREIEKKQMAEPDGAMELSKHGRLSRRCPLQVERRSALGGRELSSPVAAGAAAGVFGRGAKRPDGLAGDVRQRTDRAVPARGTDAIVCLCHTTGECSAACRWNRDDQRRAGLHLGRRTAMAQAGVKYWSIGPNYVDRIGTHEVPGRTSRSTGSARRARKRCCAGCRTWAMRCRTSRRRNASRARIIEFLDSPCAAGYPYELVHLRWSGYGDNAVPDETLPDLVKTWNAHHAYAAAGNRYRVGSLP